MFFKFCQILVAVFMAIASLFTPSQTIPPTPPENVGINVNPNPIADAVTYHDLKTMSFNVKISFSNSFSFFFVPGENPSSSSTTDKASNMLMS